MPAGSIDVDFVDELVKTTGEKNGEFCETNLKRASCRILPASQKSVDIRRTLVVLPPTACDVQDHDHTVDRVSGAHYLTLF